jgi:hypothetical protein
VAHAADWAIAGANPRQFHLTNVLLHAASAVLVLIIGRALAPQSAAGIIAALLFALHASNHEAVVWISARFDLLATFFSLAALWWTVRAGAKWSVLAPFLFLLAVLSKEAAVAMPVAAGAFAVFVQRASTTDTVRRIAPWLVALVAYAVLRHLGGGVSPIGGFSRVPKLAALGLMLTVLLLLADGRWLMVRAWLRDRRGAVAAAFAIGLAVLAAAAARQGGTGIFADKLAVAGFSLFHLASPLLDVFDLPFYQQTGTTIYWLGGVIAIGAALAVVVLAWRALLDDDRLWFLGAFLAAALLPISALTEGARYLYLPSAAFSLLVGTAVAEARGRARLAGLGIVTIVLALSSAQIVVKVRDWKWAGRLTAEGARTVDASLAPACGGYVIFLTAPVAIRGVYTHFYYETFEPVRGCMPDTFQILARVVRRDAIVEARWDGPSTIVITVPEYGGNFVLAKDLRQFDMPLREAGDLTLSTPLGELRGERVGNTQRLTLALAPAVLAASPRIFYYSDGRMVPLAK